MNINEGTKLTIDYVSIEPKLSLCIPTKNRSTEFNNLLNNVRNQLSLEIEVVVRDDSDNNDTLEIFKKYIIGNKFQYQYFQGSAAGLDRANLFLLEKARGDYIWWFGDDDLIINNGIKEVIKLVEDTPDISFIWANFAQNSLDKLSCNSNSRFFEDLEDLFLTLGHNLGLLSTYILKREDGLKFIHYGYKYIKGFSFVPTAIVAAMIANNYKAYLLKGPYVLNIPSSIEDLKKMMVKKNSEYQNNAFKTYGVYYREIVDSQKHVLSKSGYIKIQKLIFNPVWKGIYVAWLGGWDNPKGKKIKMLKLYWFLPECWLALYLFSMPKFFNQYLYKIYKFLFRKVQ
tara:strand:- start:14755 stop:15780 length:1026 start_codon:yes stop_codon:yes gene_type:complete